MSDSRDLPPSFLHPRCRNVAPDNAPTLAVAQRLLGAATSACAAVTKGDSDAAIERLREAQSLCHQALEHFACARAEPEMDRERCLKLAREAVGARQSEYGDPSEFFERVARIWGAMLNTELGAHDVPLLLVVLKLARLSTNPKHADSWVDVAGYAAIGAESALRTAP